MEAPCPDCVSGSLSEGKPNGTIEKFAGYDTYISRPEAKNPKSAIIMATDVFGPTLINAQLIADGMAKETGFLVVIPDLFDGGAMPAEKMGAAMEDPEENETFFQRFWRGVSMVPLYLRIMPFLYSHGNVLYKMPIMSNVIKTLKEQEGIQKIGVIGYCYGGKIAVLMGGKHENVPQVDAIAAAHPSFLKVPADIEALDRPSLFMFSEVDPMLSKEKADLITSIVKKKGVPFSECTMYEKVKHGFAVRGNDKKPEVAAARRAALAQGNRFFMNTLKV